MAKSQIAATTAAEASQSFRGGGRWRVARKLIRSLLVGYALVCVLMMGFERQLVYPAPGSAVWTPNDPTIEEVWFDSEDGTALHGWFFSHPNPKCSILYCHGNGEDVSHNGPWMAQMRDTLSCSMFLFDYRGYGRSTGTPHEAGLILDGLAAQAWLASKMGMEPSRTVLWGRSLGGGVAVAIAQQRGARALVLQNTFHSMSEVAADKFPWLPVRWMLRNQFPSFERIKEYHGPHLQSHGTSDRIIPIAMGKALFDAAPGEDKRFLEIPGGHHNDPLSDRFLTALVKFLDALPPDPDE